MATRRSILTAAREEKPIAVEPAALPPPEPAAQPIAKRVKPARLSKKHIGENDTHERLAIMSSFSSKSGLRVCR